MFSVVLQSSFNFKMQFLIHWFMKTAESTQYVLKYAMFVSLHSSSSPVSPTLSSTPGPVHQHTVLYGVMLDLESGTALLPLCLSRDIATLSQYARMYSDICLTWQQCSERCL
jgi:hypothetical protein